MKASAKPMGTYPSLTVVTTWTATNPTQSSERLRWTSWERNRGHRSVVQPTEATTPRTTVAVSRTRATSPVERVRYQRAFWLDPLASAARAAVLIDSGRAGLGSGVGLVAWSVGHPATVTTEPSWATRRAGSRRSSSQSTAAPPLTMAAVEAVLASTHVPGGHRHRPPVRVDRQPGRRVDQVVDPVVAEPPVRAGRFPRWRGHPRRS